MTQIQSDILIYQTKLRVEQDAEQRQNIQKKLKQLELKKQIEDIQIRLDQLNH